MWPCRNLRKSSESSFAPWYCADVRSQCDHATETPQKSSVKLSHKILSQKRMRLSVWPGPSNSGRRAPTRSRHWSAHCTAGHTYVRTRVRTRVHAYALCVRWSDFSICTLHHVRVRTYVWGRRSTSFSPLFFGREGMARAPRATIWTRHWGAFTLVDFCHHFIHQRSAHTSKTVPDNARGCTPTSFAKNTVLLVDNSLLTGASCWRSVCPLPSHVGSCPPSHPSACKNSRTQ